MAKIESPVELSYICFDEPIKKKFSEVYDVGIVDSETNVPGGALVELPDGVRMVDDGNGNRVREKVDPWVYPGGIERIYKGEGKVTFISYFSFAKSTFKVLPQIGNEYYEDSDKWAISSGILSADNYHEVDKYNNNVITVYNAGDVPVGFRLYCPFVGEAASATTNALTLRYTHRLDNSEAVLVLNGFQAKPCEYDSQDNPTEYDVGFLIDTNSGLIIGVKPQYTAASTIIYDPETYELIEAGIENQRVGITYDVNHNVTYTTSGNLYNEYVKSGYFFKLEPDDLYDETELDNNSKLVVENGVNGIEIFYDYLYF